MSTPSTMVTLAELRGTVLPRGCPVFSAVNRLPAVVIGHSAYGPVLSTPLDDSAFICLAEPWGLAQGEGGEPAAAWVDLMPWAVESLVVRHGASDEDRDARRADLQDRLPGMWWPSQALGEQLVIRARSWCVTLRPRGERTRVRGGLIEIDRWPIGAMPVGPWPDGVPAGRQGEDLDAPARLKARVVLAEALRQGALRDRGVGAVQAPNGAAA